MSLFGSGSKAKSTEPDRLGGIKIQSSGYANAVPLIFGRVRIPITLFFYSNFQATPVYDTKKSSGKGGKKKKPAATSYSYTAAVMMGIASNVIASTGKLWIDKKKYNTIAEQGFTLFTGTSTQAPWGYLSTYEPTKAVNLRNFAYLAANNYALSDNATLGNHSVEVFGALCGAGEGDSNPADFLPYIMINQCGIASASIADTSIFRADCAAQDWLFSVALSEQFQASEFITEILTLCGTEMVMKQGQFHFINYKDTDLVTGYNLNSDDFIADQGAAPIKLTRKKAIDSNNALKLEFLNRANDYNVEIAEDQDLASIESIGLRAADTIKAHYICRVQQARNIVHQLLQRNLVIRNSYEFTLSLRYIRLEPMDVITITDTEFGLVGQAVVIKKIVLTPDFKLNITAEDSIWQVWESTAYPVPVSAPYIPDYTVAVGNINAPVIFIAPSTLTSSGYEIWCAISSSDENYGGCDIHISIDGGVSYQRIGSHAGNARMGVLTADLASGSEIDTVHTLAVDLTQSNGVLTSVGQVSVDTLETLCRVNDEFIVYRDVALTSVSHYAISYLRRGLYGSSQGAATGDKFVRCDDTLFKFPYSPAYQGMTIKLKFTSFNIYQEAQQDISVVPAYDFLITGTNWDSNSSQWDSGTTFWTA